MVKLKSTRLSELCSLTVADSSTVRSAPLQGRDTSSYEAINQARSWMEVCKRDHSACSNRYEPSDFCPTRLVDLNPASEDEDCIRVIETTSTPVHQPYMTLSHRWGKHQFPMFTEANRPQMLRGFSLKSLPQAFQDACHVARQLNVGYLWVDCLCILQGSAQDFEREAGLMHRVYGNSYCNICATGAKDNHEPLFTTRQFSSISQTEVELAWREGSGRQYTLFDAQLWKRAVFRRPVNQRAWVMQERFLAPCVLHFGAGQLLWECRQLHACEQYPDGLPAAITFGAYDLKTIDLPREADLDMSPQLRMYKLWCVLLSTYTRCGLTQAKDKLIALAGIATRVHETLQDTFLAGLWKSWLLYDLCWQVDFIKPADTPKRLDFYRAPSWSWASLDGPINLGGSVPVHPTARLACEIVEASAVPAAQSNPFGAVKSAELIVRGRLNRFVVTPDQLLESSPESWHQVARAGAARFEVNGAPLLRMGIAVNFDNAPSKPPATGIWCIAIRREDHEQDDDWYDSDDGPMQSEVPGKHGEASAEPRSFETRPTPVSSDPFIFGLVVVAVNHDETPADHLSQGFRTNQRSARPTATSDDADAQAAEMCFQRMGVFTLGGNDVVHAYEAASGDRLSTFRLI